MKHELMNYIDNNFPNLYSDIHLRFELGEPYENGTDERINQVMNRVITILEEIFNLEANIYLFIKDYEQEDIMFGNLTPNYLFECLNGHELEEEYMFDLDEDVDVQGNTILVNTKYKISILYDQLATIPYKNILKGIANYEQGRTPSIAQSIYFINKKEDLIFYMYDDRGCIIYSKSKEKLKQLYTKYNKWLVDFWRDYFDKLFLG